MRGLDASAVVRSHVVADLPLVVLLHGFGSNERDLAGLFDALPREYQYASLRGPLPIQGGFAWFPLTMHGQSLAATGGRVAARAVARWAEEHAMAPVGAIGFSQGGALALELLRESGIPSLEWAAVLSGFVLEADPESEQTDERDAALELRKPPVFWARGEQDQVITPELIARTAAWLPAHSQPTERRYAGLSHAVSAEEIDDLSTWMRERRLA